MKIIIPIIVGAIIGYFTNWLAIKMLFRPHYEKRIFGYKLPFTPGLIPKERYRIAKSIGETVGVYLLSPDTIIEELSTRYGYPLSIALMIVSSLIILFYFKRKRWL